MQIGNEEIYLERQFQIYEMVKRMRLCDSQRYTRCVRKKISSQVLVLRERGSTTIESIV